MKPSLIDFLNNPPLRDSNNLQLWELIKDHSSFKSHAPSFNFTSKQHAELPSYNKHESYLPLEFMKKIMNHGLIKNFWRILVKPFFPVERQLLYVLTLTSVKMV